MSPLKLIATALMLLTLNGCVGFIFPLPSGSSSSSEDSNRGERR